MTMSHPIDRISVGDLRRWQIPSITVASLCLIALPVVLPGRSDNTLVELVEAGTVDRAVEIIAHWSAQDRVRVAYAVGFDFLMNPAYMNVLAISCIWAGRVFQTDGVRTAASILAWLAWSVAATNAAENIGLYLALVSGPTQPWPSVVAAAHYWAGLVIVPCMLFSLAGLAKRLTRAG